MNTSPLMPILLSVAISLLKSNKSKGGFNKNRSEEFLKSREEIVENMIEDIERAIRPIPIMQIETPTIVNGKARKQVNKQSYKLLSSMSKRGKDKVSAIWEFGTTVKNKKDNKIISVMILSPSDRAVEFLKKLKIQAKKSIESVAGRCKSIEVKTDSKLDKATHIAKNNNRIKLASIGIRKDGYKIKKDYSIIQLTINIDTISELYEKRS